MAAAGAGGGGGGSGSSGVVREREAKGLDIDPTDIVVCTNFKRWRANFFLRERHTAYIKECLQQYKLHLVE